MYSCAFTCTAFAVHILVATLAHAWLAQTEFRMCRQTLVHALLFHKSPACDALHTAMTMIERFATAAVVVPAGQLFCSAFTQVHPTSTVQ
jgi:hypothetical protein